MAAWDKAFCHKERQFEWKNKHSAAGLVARAREAAAARARVSTGAILQDDGKYLCPHEGCGVTLILKSMRLHVGPCGLLDVAVRTRRAQQRAQRLQRRNTAAAPGRPARNPEANPPVPMAPPVPVNMRRVRLVGKQARPPDFPRPSKVGSMVYISSGSSLFTGLLKLKRNVCGAIDNVPLAMCVVSICVAVLA